MQEAIELTKRFLAVHGTEWDIGVRSAADGRTGLRRLAGLRLALAEVPDPLGAGAEVPEAQRE
jgi:hypothetical protein